jgi:hypothetical protein
VRRLIESPSEDAILEPPCDAQNRLPDYFQGPYLVELNAQDSIRGDSLFGLDVLDDLQLKGGLAHLARPAQYGYWR